MKTAKEIADAAFEGMQHINKVYVDVANQSYSLHPKAGLLPFERGEDEPVVISDEDLTATVELTIEEVGHDLELVKVELNKGGHSKADLARAYKIAEDLLAEV